jgi:BlaI family transcriptional regulator, penicillinase repressor
MDSKPRELPTETELSLLQLLWDQGPATIRRLTELLYPGGSASHYATVQKLLERLEDKGYVRRDRSSMTHVFDARIGRDQYIGGQMRAMADRLCGGSLTPLLTHLLQAERLSAEERRELRRLLNQPDRPKSDRDG